MFIFNKICRSSKSRHRISVEKNQKKIAFSPCRFERHGFERAATTSYYHVTGRVTAVTAVTAAVWDAGAARTRRYRDADAGTSVGHCVWGTTANRARTAAPPIQLRVMSDYDADAAEKHGRPSPGCTVFLDAESSSSSSSDSRRPGQCSFTF